MALIKAACNHTHTTVRSYKYGSAAKPLNFDYMILENTATVTKCARPFIQRRCDLEATLNELSQDEDYLKKPSWSPGFAARGRSEMEANPWSSWVKSRAAVKIESPSGQVDLGRPDRK